VLKGGRPIQHRIANQRFNPRTDAYFSGTLVNECWPVRTEDFDNIDALDVTAPVDLGWLPTEPGGRWRSSKKSYIRRPHKMHWAIGKIRRPVKITPYIYSKNNVVLPNIVVDGSTLHYGKATEQGDPVELTVVKTSGKFAGTYVFRFGVRFAVFPANVVVKEVAYEELPDVPGETNVTNLDVYGPYAQAGGGHYIVLNEPLCTVYNLTHRTLKNVTDESGEHPKIEAKELVVAITHGWGATGPRANISVSAATAGAVSNDDWDSSGYHGSMENAEYWTIDSTVNRNGEWDNLTMTDEDDGTVFPGLGEYVRSVIDYPPIVKSVDELTPTYMSDENDESIDEQRWQDKWAAAQASLKLLVRKEALRVRQLVTVGELPIVFDADLLLTDRVSVIGTRDDQLDEDERMRLASMRARIQEIRLDENDTLRLVFTSERALQKWSIYDMLQGA